MNLLGLASDQGPIAYAEAAGIAGWGSSAAGRGRLVVGTAEGGSRTMAVVGRQAEGVFGSRVAVAAGACL